MVRWTATCVAFVWVAALWWAPVLMRSSQVIEGSVGRVVYLAGAAVCHQRPERSFRRFGRALPVCGRCTGIYVGGAIGLLAAALSGVRRPGAARGYRALLIGAAVPTCLTLLWEWSAAGEVSNLTRAAAAIPVAAVAGWMIGVALPISCRTGALPGLR